MAPSECAEPRRRPAHRAGRPTGPTRAATPRAISDLDPYLDEGFATHTVDFSRRPPEVVVVADAALRHPGRDGRGTRVSEDTGVRVQASLAAIVLGFGPTYVLGYVVTIAAVFLQGGGWPGPTAACR